MARMTIKSTYSLDVQTVRALESMARRWGVSKSEALRRAIRAAAENLRDERSEAVEALTELQNSLNLTAESAQSWAARVRTERRAWSRRREGRTD